MGGVLIKRWVCSVMLAAFGLTSVLPSSYAQSVLSLPPPGQMVALSPAFNSPGLKGIKVYPDNPLRFDFILDKGDDKSTDEQIKIDSTRLIKYFLASMTIPEKDLWVNLSPYEKDRIVPEAFGQTEMGRDLLAQDCLLKQITASVIYPEGEIGKKFWKKVYALAQEKYGTTDIPVDTFNKVWIVPEKAVVYENARAGAAYVTEARLKVMLETDYLADEMARRGSIYRAPCNGPDCLEGRITLGAMNGAPTSEAVPVSDIAKSVLREVVIPVLEKEVNEGKNFALLRQIYQSLILASWYKKKVRESLLAQVYVGRNKTFGVNNTDPKEAEKIWGQYVEMFKKGAYNIIQDAPINLLDETIPRRYFSGGLVFSDRVMDPAMSIRHGLGELLVGVSLMFLNVALAPADPIAGQAVENDLERSCTFLGCAYRVVHNNVQYSLVRPSGLATTLRFEKIFGADIDIDGDLLQSVLAFVDDHHNEQEANALIRSIQALLGEDIILRYGSAQLFSIAANQGMVRLTELRQRAADLFGEGTINAERGGALVALMDIDEESTKLLGLVVASVRSLFGVRADQFFAVSFVDFWSDPQFTGYWADMARLMNELATKSVFTDEQIAFLSENSHFFNSLLTEARSLKVDQVVRYFRFVARYSDEPWVQLRLPSAGDGVRKFLFNHDMEKIKDSLAEILGQDAVGQLFSVRSVESFAPFVDLPEDFWNNPRAFLSGIKLDQGALRLLSTTPASLAMMIANRDRINRQGKIQEVLKRIGLMPSGFLELAQTMGFFPRLVESIVDGREPAFVQTFLPLVIAREKAYAGNGGKKWAEQLRKSGDVVMPDTAAGRVKAVSIYRQQALLALNYMVATGLLDDKILPKDRWNAFVSRLLYDDRFVADMKAMGDRATDWRGITDYRIPGSLSDAVVVHDVTDFVLRSSDMLGWLYTFAYLQDTGRSRDILKIKSLLSGIGKGALTDFENALKALDAQEETDWRGLARKVQREWLGLSDEEILWHIFLAQVQSRPLNSAQTDFIREQSSRVGRSAPILDFARSLKTLEAPVAKLADSAQRNGGVDLTSAAEGVIRYESNGAGINFRPSADILRKLRSVSGFVPIITGLRQLTITVPEFLGMPLPAAQSRNILD